MRIHNRIDNPDKNELTWVVNGDLTSQTVMDFMTQVKAHKNILSGRIEVIVLDCQNLSCLDGSGIGALSIVNEELIVDKLRLKLHNVNGQPKKLINVLSLNNLTKG